MIDLQPTICNLCGGEVEYITNDKIYGKQYGSGWCYHCKQCNAYVGTNKLRPKEALGILATEEMKSWKISCHKLFDKLWKEDGYKRGECYKWLADEMRIPVDECHFGYFDIPKLRQSYAILKNKKP